MTLHPIPLNFLIYEGIFFFLFISVRRVKNANFLLPYIQKYCRLLFNRNLSAMEKQLDPVQLDIAVMFSMHVESNERYVSYVMFCVVI